MRWTNLPRAFAVAPAAVGPEPEGPKRSKYSVNLSTNIVSLSFHLPRREVIPDSNERARVQREQATAIEGLPQYRRYEAAQAKQREHAAEVSRLARKASTLHEAKEFLLTGGDGDLAKIITDLETTEQQWQAAQKALTEYGAAVERFHKQLEAASWAVVNKINQNAMTSSHEAEESDQALAVELLERAGILDRMVQRARDRQGFVAMPSSAATILSMATREPRDPVPA